ncbi:hypothetical protein LJR220_002529 [Bradyrhizobium sp. LjRoot220]|uniref:hypothetical protein n=1 Tax=Bradyrhizobium sp. LjRoot220 TaxID=3342284 RepID=UPI003ECF25BF
MPTTLVPLRIELSMRTEVRDYQRREEDLPPLSEAVRRLLRLGLRHAQTDQHRKKKAAT